MKAYAKVGPIIVPIMLLGGATAVGSNRVSSRDPTLNAIERALATYSQKAPNTPKYTQASNGVDHNAFEYETNGHIVRTTMSHAGAPILRKEQLKHLNYTVPTPRVEDLPILAFHSDKYDPNDIFVKSVKQARRDNKLNKLLRELGFMIKTGSSNTIKYKKAYSAIISVCEQNEIPYKKRASRHDSWRRRPAKHYDRQKFRKNVAAGLDTILLDCDSPVGLPGDLKDDSEDESSEDNTESKYVPVKDNFTPVATMGEIESNLHIEQSFKIKQFDDASGAKNFEAMLNWNGVRIEKEIKERLDDVRAGFPVLEVIDESN